MFIPFIHVLCCVLFNDYLFWFDPHALYISFDIVEYIFAYLGFNLPFIAFNSLLVGYSQSTDDVGV